MDGLTLLSSVSEVAHALQCNFSERKRAYNAKPIIATAVYPNDTNKTKKQRMACMPKAELAAVRQPAAFQQAASISEVRVEPTVAARRHIHYSRTAALPPHVTPLSIQRTVVDRILHHRVQPPAHKVHYNNYCKTLYAILRDHKNIPVWFEWSGLKCAVFYHKTDHTVFAVPDTAVDDAMLDTRISIAYQRALNNKSDTPKRATCVA